MKRIIYILSAIAVFAFSSCLKDPKITDELLYGDFGIGSGNALIEFPNAPVVNTAVGAMNHDTTFALTTIRLNSAQPAGQDIQVTIELDQAALDAYNNSERATAEANGLDYVDFEIPPSDVYTIENMVITIPAGERQANVNVTFNPADFVGMKYAIPLKLVSSTPSMTLSGNYSSMITGIAIKNKYDGVYSLTGYHNRVPYNFPYEDIEMHLVTQGENSVAAFWPEAGDFGHPIGVAPGAVNWYGPAIAPVFTFNLQTDEVVSASNLTPGTAISLYTAGPDPAMENKYDAGTQTLKVSWMYGGNPQRAFFDTFVYTGSRP